MMASLMVTILLAVQACKVHSHAVYNVRFTLPEASETPEAHEALDMDMDESSGVMYKDWPDPEDSNQQCTGMTGSVRIRVRFSDLTGCYRFRTPGFGGNGYPNATGGLTKYECSFSNQFGGTAVSGTMRVPSSTFEFQPKDSRQRCSDHLLISGVIPRQSQPTDSDDISSSSNTIQYCGNLSQDKIYDFNARSILIKLKADVAITGNGAEVFLCFN